MFIPYMTVSPHYPSLYLLDIPVIYLLYIYHPFVNLFDIDHISAPILLLKHILITDTQIGCILHVFLVINCFMHKHMNQFIFVHRTYLSGGAQHNKELIVHTFTS